MQAPKKTWVIDSNPGPGEFDRDAENARFRRLHAVDGRSRPKKRKKPKLMADPLPSPPRSHPGLGVALAYLFGPLGVLLFAEGRKSGFWTALSVVSGIAWIGLALKGDLLLVAIRNGEHVLPVAGGLGLVAILGSLAWSRGVWLAVNQPGWRGGPGWMSNPPAVLVLGLLVPGLGLLLRGSRHLAAAGLWLIGLLVFPGMILLQTGTLWSGVSDPSGASGLAVEILFLVSFVTALVALVFWVVQALVGALVAAGSRTEPAIVGNALGFAFIAVLVVFAITFHPRTQAARMDGYATVLREDGFRLVPLTLLKAASFLDPAEPLYTLRTAEMHDALGQERAARGLRAVLEDRWQTYAQARDRSTRPQLTRTQPELLDATPPPRPPLAE